MKYKIYCENELIHHQNVEELKITNAVVELEQNAIGTFEFDIYPTNPYINEVKDMQSEITVYQDDYLLFKGLACNSQIGYRNKKKVSCKQDYFYLTFSAIEPFEFTGTPQELFAKFVTEHNAQVDEKHQFKIGECTVTDPNNYITRSNEESQSAWDNIKSKLVDILGGYLRIRYEADGAYLDYLSDFATKNVQDVEFGKNLLDVTREQTGLDVATVIVPYGAKNEETKKRVTIEEVNNGAIFLEDAEAVELYGRIRKVVTWDDVTEPYNLLTKAREWLGTNKSKIVGITITAFDLAHTNKDIGSFKMFSYIKVISEYHSLNDLYLPLKMKIDLFNVKNNKIELNTTGKSFTDYQIEESKKFENIIENVGSVVNSTLDNTIVEIRNEVNSSITQSESNITSEVADRYYTKGDVELLLGEISTRLEQTNNSFQMTFKEVIQSITNLDGTVNANYNELVKYIRFMGGEITLGEVNNPLTLTLSNDRMSFIQNGNEVAYISDNRLYIKDVEILHSLRLNRWVWIVRDNGNLSLKKI